MTPQESDYRRESPEAAEGASRDSDPSVEPSDSPERGAQEPEGEWASLAELAENGGGRRTSAEESATRAGGGESAIRGSGDVALPAEESGERGAEEGAVAGAPEAAEEVFGEGLFPDREPGAGEGEGDGQMSTSGGAAPVGDQPDGDGDGCPPPADASKDAPESSGVSRRRVRRPRGLKRSRLPSRPSGAVEAEPIEEGGAPEAGAGNGGFGEGLILELGEAGPEAGGPSAPSPELLPREGVVPEDDEEDAEPSGAVVRRAPRRRQREEPAARERGEEPAESADLARSRRRPGSPRGDAPRGAPSVRRRIVVNATDPEEIRIAVLANQQLEELFYERTAEKKYLGNIYKGKVVNLEPAIQAAFVDIGIGRNGFLHVSDVLPAYKDATTIPVDSLSERTVSDWKRLRIQEILRTGQEVLVQISKDSIGAKGPSLTTYVSVPGKYLVLMPGVNRHGVSKRIEDSAERAELREKLAGLNPPEGVGYIVRTAGQEKPQEVLAKDFEYLMGVWDDIGHAVEREPGPALLYAESDLVIRALRDIFGADVQEIVIDEGSVYERARRFLDKVMPQAARRLKRYTGPAPLFSRFGVEEAIDQIYNRRVPLASGGHLVIEQTEALVAIDVNSGKYRDEEDLEATALKTNLEAAEEIARQLRLRDLGGVIIIDFIDMEVLANRREVERALRAALREDRAKTWFTRVSRFGIVEMTRQRVRPSFERANYEPCKICQGTGVVKSPRNTGIAILRQLRGVLGKKRRNTCEVLAHPDVASYLVNARRQHLVELETEFNKTIVVSPAADFSPEQYTVRYR